MSYLSRQAYYLVNSGVGSTTLCLGGNDLQTGTK